MESLERQVQYVAQVLQCSATLEHVSPSMRICHLAIPWCGRQLHWQVLLPAPPHSAPDLLFDDDSFHPLCGPPLPHHPHPQAHSPLQPGRPGSSQAAFRTLLRSWSATSSAPPSTAAAGATKAPHGGGSPPADQPRALDRLCRLVSVLLESYQEHQLVRLAAAAAALPRLQFELSTLELGPGVQLELQQQQACFSLRLPPLDLRRLLEQAELCGAALPPPLQPSAPERAPPQHPHFQPPPGAPTPAGGGGDGVTELRGEPPGPGLGGAHTDDRNNNLIGQPSGAAAAGVAGAHEQQQPLPSGLEFTLLASFRLPATVGGSGDLADPELTLQLPRPLLELKAQEAGVAAAGGGADGFAGGGPSLVPSFLLPLWSPHMCLAEFVPLAVERLRAQLDAHCNLLATRQQLLEQLCELLGPPLELNLRGGAALFVVAWEGSPVLVSLELGSRFPADKPAVVLQCVRVLPGADSSRTYRDYPWSPRWAPAQMAARIHNWLQEELPGFVRGRAPQS